MARLSFGAIRDKAAIAPYGPAKFERIGLKLITFSGIVVPLITGSLIQTLYNGVSAPGWLVKGSSLISLAFTALSVWALVDKWEDKVQAENPTMRKFSALVIELELLKPDASGKYDETKLAQMEWEAKNDGRVKDDLRGVSEHVKKDARQKAEAKFPAA